MSNMEYRNGRVWSVTTLILFILFITILISLTSCATKKRVVETEKTNIEVKIDSSDVQSVKIDSADTSHKTENTEKEKVETETKVEKSDSTVMTVDKDGNVIKQETWHKEKETVSRNREYERQLRDSIAHYRLIQDSLTQYRAKFDSLQQKLIHKESKVTEVIKIPKWCWYCAAFSILCIIFATYKLIRWVRTIWGRT